MGPGDPFASQTAAASQSAASQTATPDRRDAAPGVRTDARPFGATPAASASEPVRVQARTPGPSALAGAVGSRPVWLGAAVGLAVGLLFVILRPGQAVLVLTLTALGAALGAILRTAFADGVDPAAAWRALRRR